MAQDPREIVIRNLILMQRLGNTLSAESAELLRALFDEIVVALVKLDPTAVQPRYRRDRLEALSKRIQDLVGPAYEELLSRQRAALAQVGAHQAQGATRYLRTVLGAGGAGAVAPSTGLGVNFFRALIDTQPLQGALLKDWFRDQSRKTAFRVNQQLQLGMVNGETIDDMVRRIRGRANGPPIRDRAGKITGYQFTGGVMGVSTRDAEAIVRTAVNHFSNAAAEATYRANSDITSEYQFVATLDSRTTLLCASLDGKAFRYDDSAAPRPPQHVRCRSIIVPIVDWAGLGMTPPPEGTRASNQGQVKASTTYEEWLKRQPRGVQDDVLGPTRGQLFRQGKVTLRDLVRTDGGRIRLSDLQVSEPPAFDIAAARQKLRAGGIRKRDFDGATPRDAESVIHDAPVEHAVGFASDGTVAFHATDNHPAKVGFTAAQLVSVRNGVLTHNHPRSSSLSDADLALAHNWNLAEIRAASRLYDYSATRPAAGWWRAPGEDGSGVPTREAIGRAWDRHEAALRARYAFQSGRTRLTEEEWRELTHELLQELSQEFGFGYTRTTRSP